MVHLISWYFPGTERSTPILLADSCRLLQREGSTSKRQVCTLPFSSGASNRSLNRISAPQSSPPPSAFLSHARQRCRIDLGDYDAPLFWWGTSLSIIIMRASSVKGRASTMVPYPVIWTSPDFTAVDFKEPDHLLAQSKLACVIPALSPERALASIADKALSALLARLLE